MTVKKVRNSHDSLPEQFEKLIFLIKTVEYFKNLKLIIYLFQCLKRFLNPLFIIATTAVQAIDKPKFLFEAFKL